VTSLDPRSGNWLWPEKVTESFETKPEAIGTWTLTQVSRDGVNPMGWTVVRREIGPEATGKVGEDRTVVVAVRGAHELAQWSHLKAMLAHQACDRLVIDDHALGVKLTSDAAVAVAWGLGTQRLKPGRAEPFSPPPCGGRGNSKSNAPVS